MGWDSLFLSSMESMSVIDEAGQAVHASLPDMSYRQTSASLEYVRGLLDLQMPVSEITTLLNKMMLPSSPSEDNKQILVQVPPTRSGRCSSPSFLSDLIPIPGGHSADEHVGRYFA